MINHYSSVLYTEILLYIISDSYLISETLHDRDACCEHGVQWEDDIIQHNRIDAARMPFAIFVLQAFDEVESTIEHAVQRESNYVQCYEIKVQALYRLASVVDPDLWIKRHGPGHKIYPAKDNGGIDYGLRLGHNDPNKQIFSAARDEIYLTLYLYTSVYICEIDPHTVMHPWSCSLLWPPHDPPLDPLQQLLVRLLCLYGMRRFRGTGPDDTHVVWSKSHRYLQLIGRCGILRRWQKISLVLAEETWSIYTEHVCARVSDKLLYSTIERLSCCRSRPTCY